MNNSIDFGRVKRSRKITTNLLSLDHASRCVLYAAAQPFLTDFDREKINQATPLFDALRIAEAMRE